MSDNVLRGRFLLWSKIMRGLKAMPWILKLLIVGAIASCAIASHREMAQAVEVTVTIDPSVRFQTIRGWQGGYGSLFHSNTHPTVREQLLDLAVNDLGLTGQRIGIPRGNFSVIHGSAGDYENWEWLNDDGDPENIYWPSFGTATVDKMATNWLVPYKQRVEATGESFQLLVNPFFGATGSSGVVPVWLFNSPGEYAEFALAFLLYLRNKHGLVVDSYGIENEPGFSAAVIKTMIETLAPKLQQLGFPTQFHYPEGITAQSSWNYIQALQDDAEFWQHIGLLTYHLYGTNDPYRSYMRDFGIAKGIPTAMTEYGSQSINTLYEDLTLGGVSSSVIQDMPRLNSETSFSHREDYWSFRQVTHYVRPGAVRIGATSSDSGLRPLAFERNGEMVVVLFNNTDSQRRTVTIRNLNPGTYGISQSVQSSRYQERGLQTVSSTGTLTVDIPARAILTIYPYAGVNQPPTVTDWKATPNFVSWPASSTTLSAAATDPELDRLSYAWSVTGHPAGANPVLTTPQAASTSVTGLSVAGEYIFTVAVSDGAHTVRREVVLKVYPGNQPPTIVEVHNRVPVMVTLPTESTELRGFATDLEGDPLTFQWSVVRQPPGAAATLANPTAGRCPVSNMKVPGDYVFKFEVSDPTHTVSVQHTVTVFPVNRAPIISSAEASPARLTLPTSRTTLSATTSDPDGDVISHWWSVKSAPAGAKPVFRRQGAPNTNVSDLSVAGTYTFTLTVVDRAGYTSRDVTVTVN